jgi:hypothetical protein
MNLSHILDIIHNKKIGRVIGIVGTVVAVFLLVVGGITVFGNRTDKDDEGFYSIWDLDIERDSCAVVVSPEGIELSPGRSLGDTMATFKVKVSNNDSSGQLFTGLAHEFDIERYLGDIEYVEIEDLYVFPVRVKYSNHPGGTNPGAPGSQKFWAVSTSGAGVQTVVWTLEPDRNWLVIMNEDGTPGININITFSAMTPLILMFGLFNITAGIFLILFSLMIFHASGKSRNIAYPGPL